MGRHVVLQGFNEVLSVHQLIFTNVPPDRATVIDSGQVARSGKDRQRSKKPSKNRCLAQNEMRALSE
jgi:hypothetical protein